MAIHFAHNMGISAVPALPLHYSNRTITEPDGFGDAVSGAHLIVDFQRRQERPSHVEQFQTTHWGLDFGIAQARTRVHGVLVGGWASLCIMRGHAPAQWNSQAGERGSLACLPPGEELDGRTEPGFTWLTVAVPPEVWTQCRALAGAGEERDVERFAAHRLPAPLFAQMERSLLTAHRLLRERIAAPACEQPDLADITAFTRDCFTTACELAIRRPPPRDSLRNRARLARRADAWMRDHLSESLRMPKICLALRVSRRELEYAFRTVFDQSPRDYLQMLRLNAIRRALRHSSDPVIRVAYDHGITHLSRFAAHYRAIFGESPSETASAESKPVAALNGPGRTPAG
jgi:AraC-like DNA-binding protein